MAVPFARRGMIREGALWTIGSYFRCSFARARRVALSHILAPIALIGRPDGSVAGERFMIPQSDKSRPIDSGKKPGHNDASVEREAAFTSSVAAFQPLLLKTRLVFRGLPVQGRLPSGPCPSGAFVCYLHSLLDNQACEHRLRVGPLAYPLLFFASRTPNFLAALCRRVCCSPVLQFFDDSGIAGLECAKSSAQASMRACFGLAGAELDPANSQAPSSLQSLSGPLSQCSFGIRAWLRQL